MKEKFLLTFFSLIFTHFAFAQSQPNILFIVVDDLNDYIQGYDGQPQVLTPVMSDLESRGCIFTNAFANAPGCAPSRTSFLSGKDISYTQIFNNSDYSGQFRAAFTPEKNNEEVFTLPEILKDSGNYFTYSINKIFHSEHESDFDDILSHDECERMLSWNKQTIIEETDDFFALAYSYAEYPGFTWGKIPDSLEKYMQDVNGTDSAIQFIKDYATGIEPACGRPFFMAMGYHRPHTARMIPAKYFPPYYVDDLYELPFNLPWNTPENANPANGLVMPPQPAVKWGDYYNLPAGGLATGVADFGSIEEDLSAYVSSLSPLPVISDTLTDDERIEIIKEIQRANHATAYIAAVQFIDAQLGRLIGELDSHPDLKNNTIIVLVSDHGYALGEKKHYTKWALWETDIRIPFMIIDPSKAGNVVNSNTVDLLDLFPTLLDITNTNSPKFSNGDEYLDGVSILPLFENPALHIEHPILTTYKKENETASCWPMYSVRSERFHYIQYRYNSDDPDITDCDSSSNRYDKELYELGVNREIDPNEWNNIADDPDYKPLINYMEDFLPEGQFYMQNIHKAVMHVSDTMPCFYAHDGVIHLQAKLFSPEGEPIEGAALGAYKFNWTNSLTLDSYAGPNYDFDMSAIPDAVFTGEHKILFYLRVTDLTTGDLQAFDIHSFSINPANLPAAHYTATLTSDSILNISDYSLTGAYTETIWDFGDGTYVYDYLPATHIYAPGTYVLRNIINYGNQCSFSVDTVLTIAGQLGVSQMPNPAFLLYPNPASTILHLNALNKPDNYTILIFDMLGRQVLTEDIRNAKTSDIDIAMLPEGTYLLKAINGSGYTTRKFEVIR